MHVIIAFEIGGMNTKHLTRSGKESWGQGKWQFNQDPGSTCKLYLI